MKKILALILALLLVIGTFAACDTAEKEPDEPKAEESEDKESEDGAEKESNTENSGNSTENGGNNTENGGNNIENGGNNEKIGSCERSVLVYFRVLQIDIHHTLSFPVADKCLTVLLYHKK